MIVMADGSQVHITKNKYRQKIRGFSTKANKIFQRKNFSISILPFPRNYFWAPETPLLDHPSLPHLHHTCFTPQSLSKEQFIIVASRERKEGHCIALSALALL